MWFGQLINVSVSILKFSSRARYALRMMVEFARQKGDDSISLGHVAKRTKISRRYLDQLVQGLKQASLIRGFSGRGGGYQLTRPAADIRVNEIIEAAIGPINVVDCVRHPEICLKAQQCECRPVYDLLNKKIIQVLEEVSLQDLANRDLLNPSQEFDLEGFACPSR